MKSSGKTMKPFQEATLEEVPREKLRAFYLRDIPGSRMQSCLVLFTQEGITITGDWCPGDNRGVTAGGYGIGWFSKELSEDYLCSKFLREEWSPEACEEELKSKIRDRVEDKEERRKWVHVLRAWRESGYRNEGDLADAMTEEGLDTCDGMPGWGYSKRDVLLLVAIQKRFRETFAENIPMEA